MKKLVPALNRKNVYYLVASVFFIWFIVAFLIYPNANIIGKAFFTEGTLSFESVRKIMRSPRALNSLKNSFVLAATLVVTANILGVFVVLVTEYFEIKGAKFLSVVYKTPMIFGGVVLASGYLFGYGAKGFITRLLLKIIPQLNPYWFSGYIAVVFVMTFACTTNHLIFLRNALLNIDYQTIEAAKNMGAGQLYILRRVVLPTLTPVLLTCTIMLFQTGLMAMSAPLMVGGTGFQTIGPMILTFSSRTDSRDIAAVLSLLLGVAEVILLYITIRIEKKGNYMSVSKVKTKLQKQKIANPIVNVVMHVVSYVMVVVYLLPLLSVIVFSFTDEYSIANTTLSLKRFTLTHYKRILTDVTAYKPFITSILYAGISSALVIILVLVAVRLILKKQNKATALLEYSLHIPWFVPPVMFALGLVITYDLPHPIMFNKALLGTIVLMLAAYIISMIPYTLRTVKASFASFDNNLEDAAKNLGASTLYTFFRVILPCILPVVLAVFALNFNGKLADYDMSVFTYHPLYPPLGVIIRNNVSNSTNTDALAINLVYSVILMVITGLVLYFVYGRGTRKKKSK